MNRARGENLTVVALLGMILGTASLAAGGEPRIRRKVKDDGPPKVMSAESQPISPHVAELLRVPGPRRSDAMEPDWREVPPWRQASFFGIRAQGQLFLYVVDCSGSMIDEDRLVRAKGELRRSIRALQMPQRFKVIFYNDQALPMPGDLPLAADLGSKERLLHWLRLIEPDGRTDPRGAVGLALALRPDAIFLLSDGEFPDGTEVAIARRNTRRVPIHCVDLGSGAGAEQLRRIARESGGQYRWRPQSPIASP